MRVDLHEDYPGELLARSPEELARAIADQVAFAKGRTPGERYKSPADFQVSTLWTLHGRMTEIGRGRLDRLKGDVDKLVGG